jgi:hypothetical protein
MGIFRKYEFESKQQFEQLKLEYNITELNGTIAELGNLRDETYSVDILWDYGMPYEWKQYEIWDIQGNGSHTFLGYEFNIEEQNTMRLPR